jgi:hypothetical protein
MTIGFIEALTSNAELHICSKRLVKRNLTGFKLLVLRKRLWRM